MPVHYASGAEGTELARALAVAMGEGAVAAEDMDVGGTNVQDVQAAEDQGLISQGTPGGFTSPGYGKVQTHEEMYPTHTQAAAAMGVTGINAFGQKHKDFIENNKSQMRAMGIQPSHKNNAGQLTGRYSSNDWKAFQSALAGGTMATEQFDDETIPMEEVVELPPPGSDPSQRPSAGGVSAEEAAMGIAAPLGQGPDISAGEQVQVGMGTGYADPGRVTPEEAAMGMAAPLGGGASPYVDDFSTYGQQVQPGVPVQIGMGTGYAPTPEASNMGMGPPLGGGGSPLVDNFSTYGQQVQPSMTPQQAGAMYDFPPVGAPVPGVGTMATEEFDAGIPGEYAFAGPQTAPGTPGFPLPGVGTGVESFTGMSAVEPPTIEETQMGMGAPTGVGMIAQGTPAITGPEQFTQGTQAGLDQSQGVALYDAAVAAAQGRLTGSVLGIEQLMRAARPIAKKDAKALIKHGISEGGTTDQRIEDLNKAGVPMETLSNLEPSAIAMLHFAFTQLVVESGTENVTFADLEPYIDRINKYSDNPRHPNPGDPSRFLDKRNPPFTGERRDPDEFLDKRNPPWGEKKNSIEFLSPM